VVSFCEHGNERSGFVKSGEGFLECRILKGGGGFSTFETTNND
jgi:hypothetical protein